MTKMHPSFGNNGRYTAESIYNYVSALIFFFIENFPGINLYILFLKCLQFSQFCEQPLSFIETSSLKGFQLKS